MNHYDTHLKLTVSWRKVSQLKRMYEMLYPFVTVSVIYCCVIMLMAQSHDHFTAHASVCQEVGQGSAGMVRLCSICYHLWGLGPQMACHSCFFHYYFSLSNLFFLRVPLQPDLFEISTPMTIKMAFIQILLQRIEAFVRAPGATNH